MSSRLIVNLLLLVAVVALVTIAIYEPGIKKPQAEPVLTALQPEDIREIVIERSGEPRIRLSKNDSGWQLAEPIATRANSFRIDSLLQIAKARSYASYPVQDKDLSRYQLQPAQGQLSLDGTVISFGGTEPIEHRRYVLVNDRIHLIADSHYYQSQLALPALVDNALVPPGRTLRALHLPGIEVQHLDNGEWKTSAGKQKISMDDINIMLDEWRQARALNVSAYENDTSIGQVRLDFADGSSLTYELLANGPDWILGRRDIGMRYQLSETEAGQLWLTGHGPAADR